MGLHLAGIGAGPLFRPINRHGQVQPGRLSGIDVARVVKKLAQRAGLDAAKYAGHSLRAGQPLRNLTVRGTGVVRWGRKYANPCPVRLRQWMTAEQQWNFDRTDPQNWRETIDRAARSMVYVLSNRILFYQAVRLRYRLPELKFPRGAKTPEKALDYLRRRFQEAVDMTGDYEPVFFPEGREWAALVALSGTNSVEAWDKVITAIDRFNFKEIPTDILGHTFQKLISPEERHKFGQHYTSEDIVDVINAFCIRKPCANVLDPACGSGSFLVRAYYRKHFLDKTLENHELIDGLYGCDVNPFPAHLTTLNLAARNITNQENYPRVVRKNFFTVDSKTPFCEIPGVFRDNRGHRERKNVFLPELDAVVGNPPYVRQEHIPKASETRIPDLSKKYIYGRAEQSWPGMGLSKQSDLHIYFWPLAASFLVDGGWFGFLTSSSWLDVRYGFPLQRWILLNFKLVAVIESLDEPWFEDARVKTAVTILQRTPDADKRGSNIVRFVRLFRPLAEILGTREDEAQRQAAAEKLRDLILKTKSDYSSRYLRIFTKQQRELWNEGLSVAQTFRKQKALAQQEIHQGTDEDPEDVTETSETAVPIATDYGGGKWGRFLRAPKFYFDVMREYGDRFVRLGEVATIKRGITSGCDAFFMPHNVTERLLSENPTEMEWQTLPLMTRCARRDALTGNVVIVQCGDGTLHPIESQFVKPEIHSLMQVDRPIVEPTDLDRVALWVEKPLKDLKGTLVHRYISWGASKHLRPRGPGPSPCRCGRLARRGRFGMT